MRKAEAAVPPLHNIDYPKYLAMMEMWDLAEAEKIAILHDFWYLVGSALDRELSEQAKRSRKQGTEEV